MGEAGPLDKPWPCELASAQGPPLSQPLQYVCGSKQVEVRPQVLSFEGRVTGWTDRLQPPGRIIDFITK